MKKYLSIIVLINTLTSCASVFNGGSQTMIAQNPDGIEGVYVNITTPSGSYRSKIPSTIVSTPSSFRNTIIKVNDKCYESTEVIVGKSLTPSFFTNILWIYGFPVAGVIDYLSGSMWKMDSNVAVPLNKKIEKGC